MSGKAGDRPSRLRHAVRHARDVLRSGAATLRRPRTAVRRLATAAVKRLAPRLGLDVVAHTVYSPIPGRPPAGSGIWTERFPTPDIELDSVAHIEHLETRLARFLTEFRPPLESHGDGSDFHLRNGYYGPVDAEVLYAMIRYHRPRRVLELGSGYSTLVSARACAANAREGRSVDLTAVDPAPRLPLDPAPAGLTQLEQRSVAEIPRERFLALESGDILFIDTSHTVKLGSEVNLLILQILPLLCQGVLVHFHDIFLPYEYPREWFERGTYPNEQYLLQAFLSGNSAWRVIFAAYAASREHPQRLARVIPTLREVDHAPSAFWLRRDSLGTPS